MFYIDGCWMQPLNLDQDCQCLQMRSAVREVATASTLVLPTTLQEALNPCTLIAAPRKDAFTRILLGLSLKSPYRVFHHTLRSQLWSQYLLLHRALSCHPLFFADSLWDKLAQTCPGIYKFKRPNTLCLKPAWVGFKGDSIL